MVGLATKNNSYAATDSKYVIVRLVDVELVFYVIN